MRRPQQFSTTSPASRCPFSSFYVDSKHVAYVSSGRLPVRAPGVDPGLPTVGTGEYDWRGFLAPAAPPTGRSTLDTRIVNWNNKPAPGFSLADDNFSYGPIHRSLLQRFLRPATRRKITELDAVK